MYFNFQYKNYGLTALNSGSIGDRGRVVTFTIKFNFYIVFEGIKKRSKELYRGARGSTFLNILAFSLNCSYASPSPGHMLSMRTTLGDSLRPFR